MSVINKVLRDLDQRQSPSTRAPVDPLRRYTVGVETPTPPRRKAASRSAWGGWWLVLLFVVVGAVAGSYAWLRWQAPTEMPSNAPLTLQLKDDDVLNLPASLSVAPVENPMAVEPVSVPEPTPPAIVAPAVPAPVEPAIEAKSPPRAVAPTPRPAAEPVPQPATKSQPVPVAPAKSEVPAAAVGSAPASLPPAAAPSTAQRQQQAARDALAQAQTLWNTGSQDTAVATLQAAVAVAERQDGGGMLLPLVRELARMELAQGQPAAVLELLVRLEPQLKNQPDLWAVRANAAQRLGRHQDSVLAYGVALQSRPAEARWLLGMAVSLAAMGQTQQAGAMVEKARASGPISPDVALYLRQQGVPMPDGK
jgi:MSHA biogenesis protein MshN